MLANPVWFINQMCALPHACNVALKHQAADMQGDADKARLREIVLTPDEGVGCAARWRADCERYAVERAGFWMSVASSAPGAPLGAGTADVAPAQQLAEVPGGSGYISLGGVLVPSRGAQGAPVDTRAFVRTPTAEQNLQAFALVLCQRQPLLLEGPPGLPNIHLQVLPWRREGQYSICTYISLHPRAQDGGL